MNSTAPTRALPRTLMLARIAAALLGSYGFAWGFVSAGITLLLAAGMAYDQAWMLAMILVFPLLLAALLWAMSARSLRRVWLVLVGGGATMTLLAWALLPQLVVH